MLYARGVDASHTTGSRAGRADHAVQAVFCDILVSDPYEHCAESYTKYSEQQRCPSASARRRRPVSGGADAGLSAAAWPPVRPGWHFLSTGEHHEPCDHWGRLGGLAGG